MFLGAGAIVPSFVPIECPRGMDGYVGYIRKALEKGFLEVTEGGSRTIFFRKLAVTIDSLGFFLLVLVGFQTDCTLLGALLGGEIEPPCVT